MKFSLGKMVIVGLLFISSGFVFGMEQEKQSRIAMIVPIFNGNNNDAFEGLTTETNGTHLIDAVKNNQDEVDFWLSPVGRGQNAGGVYGLKYKTEELINTLKNAQSIGGNLMVTLNFPGSKNFSDCYLNQPFTIKREDALTAIKLFGESCPQKTQKKDQKQTSFFLKPPFLKSLLYTCLTGFVCVAVFNLWRLAKVARG